MYIYIWLKQTLPFGTFQLLERGVPYIYIYICVCIMFFCTITLGMLTARRWFQESYAYKHICTRTVLKPRNQEPRLHTTLIRNLGLMQPMYISHCNEQERCGLGETHSCGQTIYFQSGKLRPAHLNPEIPSPTRDEALAKAAEVKPPPAQMPVEEEGGVKGQVERPLTLPTPCRSESASCLVPTLP